MSDSWQVVLSRIGAMFLVAFVGWAARRRGYFSDATTSLLGRMVVDLTFPALTFAQMLRSITPATLASSWSVLVLGVVILLLAVAVAGGVAALRAPPGSRATFVFLAGMPNWIFLPLPIAQGLYGDAGAQVVLLVNVSTQLFLWTAGVMILRGGLRGAHALRGLLANPGFLATLAGIAVALAVPGASGWEASRGPAGTLVQALLLLGNLTVPLSLLVTGAQLAGLRAQRPAQGLIPVLAARLLLAPLPFFALLLALPDLAWLPGPAARDVLALIAAMPVAVSCAMFIEKFGGHRELGAQAIGYSTMLGVVTVPALFALYQFLAR